MGENIWETCSSSCENCQKICVTQSLQSLFLPPLSLKVIQRGALFILLHVHLCSIPTERRLLVWKGQLYTASLCIKLKEAMSGGSNGGFDTVKLDKSQ